MFGFYFDKDLVEKAEFRELNLIFQTLWIVLHATMVRSRFILIWLLAEISAVIVNFRDSTTDNKDYVRVVEPYTSEFGMNTKERIDNWNIAIAIFFRKCFYEKFIEHTEMDKNTLSKLVFATSAFWHGLYPTYYLTFFLIFINLTLCRLVHKNKEILWFYTGFIERLIFDISVAVFVRYDMIKLLTVMRNIWHFILFVPAVYLLTSTYVSFVKKRGKKLKAKAA